MSEPKLLHANFVISDFMGEERCRCNDFGWDGLSRQISQNCYKCDKPHMASRFPYDTDLNRMMGVVDKLRERGFQTLIDNSSTCWTATIGEFTCTEQTLNKALHEAVTRFLNSKRVK